MTNSPLSRSWYLRRRWGWGDGMKKYVYYVSYFCTNGIGYAISTLNKKLNDLSCEELEYYINELAHDSKNKKVVPISFTFLREEKVDD